eukprot:6490761-Amphidinium_carterae.2
MQIQCKTLAEVVASEESVLVDEEMDLSRRKEWRDDHDRQPCAYDNIGGVQCEWPGLEAGKAWHKSRKYCLRACVFVRKSVQTKTAPNLLARGLMLDNMFQSRFVPICGLDRTASENFIEFKSGMAIRGEAQHQPRGMSGVPGVCERWQM